MTNQVLTIVSQSNADSIVNHAFIRATTDGGTATAQTFNIGFVPRKVKVVNHTGLILDEWFEGMAAAIGRSGLRPVIDRTFGFAEVPEALRLMERGGHFGKIAIEFP